MAPHNDTRPAAKTREKGLAGMQDTGGSGPATQTPFPLRRRFLSLPALLSMAVAVILLAFLVTRFDVDVSAAWAQVRSSDPSLFLLGAASFYASFIVRGIRFRRIAAAARLHHRGAVRLPSYTECTLMVIANWFGNAVGLLRMGDAYRAYLFSHASGSTISQSVGILVAERVADVTAICILLLVATAGVLATARGDQPLVVFPLAGLLLFALAIGVVVAMARFGVPVARRLPRPIRKRYLQFHRTALASLHGAPVTAAISAIAWLLEALRLFLVVKALGLTLSSPLVLFVTLANALLTSIPLTPGGLGLVEPGIVGLLALELPKTSAVSVATLDRSISFLSIIAVGAAVVASQRLWLRGPRGASASVPKAGAIAYNSGQEHDQPPPSKESTC